MQIQINNVNISVKKGNLIIKEGVVVEDLICKIPFDVLPSIKFDKDIKAAIVSALIEENEIETILAIKLADDAKNKPTKK